MTLCILTIANQSFAAKTIDSSKYNAFQKCTNAILSAQSIGQNKPNQTIQRLISNASYRVVSGSYYPVDSLRSFYFTDGGSKFDLNSMTYDYTNDATKNWISPLSYSSCAIMADSTIYYNKPRVNAPFAYYCTILNRFNLTNYIQGYNELNTFYINTSVKFDFLYNPSNRVIETKKIAWDIDSASLQLESVRKSTYDPLGHVTVDTLFNRTGTASSLYNYTYDVAGRITNIMFGSIANGRPYYDQGVNYEYDVSGRLITADWLSNMFTGNQLVVMTRDSFTYDGSSTFYLIKESKSSMGLAGGWYPSGFTIKHINTAGLPDTVYHSNANGIFSYDFFEYNAYGNPVTQTSFSGAPSPSNSPATIRYFTYEAHTTFIPEVEDVVVKLYPNPSKDYVILEGAKSLLNTEIRIVNVVGKYMPYSIEQDNTNSLKVGLENLTAGTYFMLVFDTQTKTSTKISFVKE